MSGIRLALVVEDEVAACAGFTEINLTEATFKATVWKLY